MGLGNVGFGHHVPAYLGMPDLVRVTAVADPSAERRNQAVTALGLGSSAAWASAADLIDRADVDVVDLATSPSIRVGLALRALDAGRSVVCEKPLATVPAEAASLVAASSEHGIPVAMIHNYLALPEIVRVRAAISEGRIGRPDVAILNYLGVEDRPGSAAWQPGWRHDPALAGGGVLMDMLHVIYVAEALVGGPIRRVSAEVAARDDDAPVEDRAFCRLEADRAIALVHVGWGMGPGGISVSGPDGRIDVTYVDGGTSPFAPLAAIRHVARGGATRDLTPPARTGPGVIDVRLGETLRAAIEAIAAGRTPPATAADGLRTLETTLAAYASAVTGRPIDLPLAVSDPVWQRGIAGLADLPLAASGWVARHGIFGVGGTKGA